MSLPRGIRNNNPLNIRRTGKDQWKGMAEVQNDRAFVQFKSLEWGWRAAFYLLTRTYYHKYRLYTIRAIISRWAPPQDNNDTSAYIANVSRLTGIDPDDSLGIPSEQPARWMMVGVAMAIQENGLIKREQSDARISSAEREDGRPKVNGTTSIDWFAMLKGWELARS